MTGMGTSQSAKDGWFTPPYVKVKGETEVALKASETESFKAAFVRPGGILATEEVSLRPRVWVGRELGGGGRDTDADGSTAPTSSGTTASSSMCSATPGRRG